MIGYHPHALAPKAFVVAGPRGVWRYVFASAAEAQRNIARARFSTNEDWLALEQALRAYANAIAGKRIDI